jgi:thiosulfate reductase cytochrome b subunit
MSDKPLARVPLWIRIWHWVMALLFLSLVLTGVVLHFAAPGLTVMDYAAATTVHDVAGIALAVVYGVFLVAVFATGYWRNYLPRRGALWRRIREQLAAYALQRATAKAPARPAEGEPRFNPLQQVIYMMVVFGLLPLLVVTGLVYLFPEYAPEKVVGLAGLWTVALAHFVAGVLGTVYVILHIYMATMGGMSRIITGR